MHNSYDMIYKIFSKNHDFLILLFRYWQTKEYYTSKNLLTYWNIEDGLRRWEFDQGFRMSIVPKLTKRELYQILRNSFTTVVFGTFVLLVLFVDFVLTEALQYIAEIEQHSIQSSVHNITQTRKFS